MVFCLHFHDLSINGQVVEQMACKTPQVLTVPKPYFPLFPFYPSHRPYAPTLLLSFLPFPVSLGSAELGRRVFRWPFAAPPAHWREGRKMPDEKRNLSPPSLPSHSPFEAIGEGMKGGGGGERERRLCSAPHTLHAHPVQRQASLEARIVTKLVVHESGVQVIRLRAGVVFSFRRLSCNRHHFHPKGL